MHSRDSQQKPYVSSRLVGRIRNRFQKSLLNQRLPRTFHYSYWSGKPARSMATIGSKHEVQLGPQGRLVIPAHLRKALDLKPGDRLVVRQDGDSIVLERGENLVKHLQARYANVPSTVSLADELIAERRTEAAGDAKD